jgi:hypothetical protein
LGQSRPVNALRRKLGTFENMATISNINTGEQAFGAPAAQPQPAPFVQPVAAPTPTQQIVDDANRIEYTTDSLGRTLGVTRINAKLRRRVLGAMSPENGEKGQLLFMSMIACACVSIDGVPVPFPMQEFTLNALIDRLEQEGMDAIGLCIAQKFPQVKRQELKN